MSGEIDLRGGEPADAIRGERVIGVAADRLHVGIRERGEKILRRVDGERRHPHAARVDACPDSRRAASCSRNDCQAASAAARPWMTTSGGRASTIDCVTV